MLGLFIQNHLISISPYAEITLLYITALPSLKSHHIKIEYNFENSIHTYRVYYPYYIRKTYFYASFHNAYIYISAIYKSWKLIRSERGLPDITHVHILTRSGLLAFYLKITKKIPYIISEHWSRYLETNYHYKGFIRKAVTRIIVSHSAAVTVVSNILRHAMIREKLHGNYHLIPNVVDMNLFRMASTKGNRKKFSSISCFEDRSKNISGMLKAIAELSQERDDFTVDLIGTGENLESLKALSNTLGLTDRIVYFRGLLRHEELAECIGQSIATILFSNYETFGTVLFESMACGVPVISTKTGVLPEFFEDYMGYMIDIQNTEQLKQAMKNFLDEKFEADQNRLRGFAEKNFSIDVVGRQFHDLYSSVIRHE